MSTGAKHFFWNVYWKQSAGMLLGMAYTENSAGERGYWMTGRRVIMILGAVLALWLGTKYLTPLVLPFLLVGAVALLAEPGVRMGQRALKLPRGVASAAGVTLSLLLLAGIVFSLAALLLRELASLAGRLPDLQNTASEGMIVLQDWLVSAADKAPEGVRPVLTRTVLNAFDGGNVLMDRVSAQVPEAVTKIVSGVPSSLLGIGTGVLSAYMISFRLPALRQLACGYLPEKWRGQYLPALKRVRKTLGLWLLAQGKLMLVTWGIVSAGFLILGIYSGPFWAVLIALVDAVPLLGTGIILVPWAVVKLLQGQQFYAVVLLSVFAAATIARSTLEPRFVGKHLGIDPLLTLLALYVGYRVWGFVGLIAAPMLAAGVKSLTELKEK
jgi:sporulation integral membrane protein YtvI